MKKLLSRRLVRFVGSILVLVVLVLALGVVRWRPSRRAEIPRLVNHSRGAGLLLAGVSEAELVFSGHVPLAGFPRLDWLDKGIRDPVSVRALVLSEPGCSIALVSVEILFVSGKVVQAVEKRVSDLRLDGVIVAATHTHSGPGGFWKDELHERIATGPYDAKIFDALVNRIAQAIRLAAAARQPAYLSIARAQWDDLARNRKGAVVDGHLLAIRLANRSGKTTAEVVVFPSHPAMFGPRNQLISGDWPGHLMRVARSEGAVRLFFQGAGGDQSAQLPNGADIPRPEIYALTLDARLRTLSFSKPDPWPALSIARASILLPEAELGAAPPFLRRFATNVLYNLVPARGRVAALQIGSAVLLAVPGEPVAEVGRNWRSVIGPDAEVLSLADDYLGYIETSERMARDLGETPRTQYGPELEARLGLAIQSAAGAAMAEEPISP